jgi:hypothetical protein
MESCCEFQQSSSTLSSTLSAAITSIWMPTGTLFFNIVIGFLFLLLLALIIWFLMRDKKRHWAHLKTRLTQSFSRYTMVSYVNNNGEVNIS